MHLIWSHQDPHWYVILEKNYQEKDTLICLPQYPDMHRPTMSILLCACPIWEDWFVPGGSLPACISGCNWLGGWPGFLWFGRRSATVRWCLWCDITNMDLYGLNLPEPVRHAPTCVYVNSYNSSIFRTSRTCWPTTRLTTISTLYKEREFWMV